MEILRLDGLCKQYPAFRLDNVSFSMEAGTIMGLIGPNGAGKTTTLKSMLHLVHPDAGQITICGLDMDTDERAIRSRIGFVSGGASYYQRKRLRELTNVTKDFYPDWDSERYARLVRQFSLDESKRVCELSEGMKVKYQLAVAMSHKAELLILDEPTSQLDPIAASDFLATLGKINRELGTTIILTEHRLEEAFSFASRVAVMDGGKLLCTGTPAEVGAELKSSGNAMFLAMPAAMRIWAASDSKATCPISVCDGRNWLLDYAKTHKLQSVPEESKNAPDTETVVSARELWFKYDKDLPDVVKGLSLELHKGEFLALLGGNGTGKTTTLKLLARLQRPYRGELTITGSVGMLPQNPQALFVKSSVRADLLEILPKSERKSERLAQVVSLCKLAELLDIDLKNAGKPEMANLPDKLRAYGAEKAAAECGVGVPTLQDIVKELVKPGRDPRDELPAPILRTDVLELKDLKPGMVLSGTVRNVIDFGVFVDIGVHQDGLVHISQVSNKFIKHPSEVVSVGDVVKVAVLDVDQKRGRISLTMKRPQ